MWSIACYPSYTPEGGVPRARRIFRRYLPAEILTYLIINFLWAGLSLWLVSTLLELIDQRAGTNLSLKYRVSGRKTILAHLDNQERAAFLTPRYPYQLFAPKQNVQLASCKTLGIRQAASQRCRRAAIRLG